MQFLTTTSEGYISLFFTLALMLVLLYFMIYRPQKKQEKKDAAMRSSLETVSYTHLRLKSGYACRTPWDFVRASV